jgi:hypothetical protein
MAGGQFILPLTVHRPATAAGGGLLEFALQLQDVVAVSIQVLPQTRKERLQGGPEVELRRQMTLSDVTQCRAGKWVPQGRGTGKAST